MRLWGSRSMRLGVFLLIFLLGNVVTVAEADCNPGYYCDEYDNDWCYDCAACPSGKTSPGCQSGWGGQCWDGQGVCESTGPTSCPRGQCLTSNACYNCDAGKYKSGTGTSCTSCSSCPSGKTSIAGSDSLTDCYINQCQAGTYLSGSTCENCIAGTYKENDATAQSACLACPTDSTISLPGTTSISDCLAPCSAGEYGAGGSSCQSCPANSDSPTATGITDISSCVCNAGYKGSSGSCSACQQTLDEYQPSTGESTCLTCAATDPLSSPTGDAATTCQCDAGTTGTFGSCAGCHPGSYKASPGSSACLSCPTNTGTAGYHSTSVNDCECLVGKTATTNGVACVDCGIGTYKDFTGASADGCVSCGTGMATLQEGSISASQCVPDMGYTTLSSGGGEYLEVCPDNGDYNYRFQMAVLNGQQTNSQGAIDNAEAVQISDLTLDECKTQCDTYVSSYNTPCIGLTFVTTPSSFVCEIHFHNSDPSFSLTDVSCSEAGSDQHFPAGYSLSGLTRSLPQISIVECEVGTYKTTPGTHTCTSCYDFSSTPSTGATSIDSCTCNTPTYVDDADGLDVCDCAPGYYYDTDSCVLCGVNHYCIGGDTSIAVEIACTTVDSNSESISGSDDTGDCVCSKGYILASGTCVACDEGQYSDTTGSTVCSVCGNNLITVSIASVSEGDCIAEANHYKSGTIGEACPANSESNQGSTSITDCTCSAGYFGPSGGPCANCPEGSYCTGTIAGPTYELALPPSGESKKYYLGVSNVDWIWSSANDQGRPSGWVQTYTLSFCAEECTLATTQQIPYATEHPGVTCYGFSSREGNSCVLWLHDLSGITSTEDNWWASSNTQTYIAVPGGGTSATVCSDSDHESDGGSDALSDCTCVAGTYGPNGGTCQDCPAGFYCGGGTTAVECPDANDNSDEKSDELTDCTCNSGYYGLNGGVCAECLPGNYCEGGTDQIACTTVDAHMTSDAGSSIPEDCKCVEGFTGTNGVSCAACSPGTYKGTVGPDSCTVCPSFTTSPSGSVNILDCICVKGYTGADGQQCAICDPGTYKDTEGSAGCTTCTGNSDSSSGSTEANNCLCRLGFTGTGSTGCTGCTGGTYKDVTGSAECSPCPSHSDSASSSDHLNDCLCDTGYSGLDGGPCTICPQGQYCVQGEASPSNCPSNSHTLSPGMSLVTECQCDLGFAGTFTSELVPATPYEIVLPPPEKGGSNWWYYGADVKNYPTRLGWTPPASVEDCAQECTLFTEQVQPYNTLSDWSGGTCYGFAFHKTFCYLYRADISGISAAGTGGWWEHDITRTYRTNTGGSDSFEITGECVACGTGFYSDTHGGPCQGCPSNSQSEAESVTLTDCKCSPGSTGSNGTACDLCEAGKFKTSVGDSACTLCTTAFSDSSSSPQGSTGVSDCQCVVGYTDYAGGNCVACEQNQYKDVVGNAQCSNCPDFSSSPTASDSIEDCSCNANYVGDPGFSECGRNCPAGFEPGTQNLRCVGCQPGYYKDVSGDTDCIICPPGSTHDLYNQTSVSACDCQWGYQRFIEHDQVEPPTDSVQCDICDDTSFGNFNYENMCHPCYTVVGGECVLSSVGDHQSCPAICQVPPGYEVTETGSNIRKCGLGTYNEGGSQLTCTPCPEGSQNLNIEGGDSIAVCLCVPGYARSDTAQACTACAPGSFQPVFDDASTENQCQACPDKTTSLEASDALGDCKCTIGNYPSVAGHNGVACLPCAEDTYKNVQGTSECQPCPGNSSSGGGSDSIEDCGCDAGYIGPSSGPCVACGIGFYKTTPGALTCESCGSNTLTNAKASPAQSACLCIAGYEAHPQNGGPDVVGGSCVPSCAVGTYYSVEVGGCTPCAVNTYKDSILTAVCTPCSSPRNASALGSDEPEDCSCREGEMFLHSVGAVMVLNALTGFTQEKQYAGSLSTLEAATTHRLKSIQFENIKNAQVTVTVTIGDVSLVLFACEERDCPDGTNTVDLANMRGTLHVAVAGGESTPSWTVNVWEGREWQLHGSLESQEVFTPATPGSLTTELITNLEKFILYENVQVGDYIFSDVSTDGETGWTCQPCAPGLVCGPPVSYSPDYDPASAPSTPSTAVVVSAPTVNSYPHPLSAKSGYSKISNFASAGEDGVEHCALHPNEHYMPDGESPYGHPYDCETIEWFSAITNILTQYVDGDANKKSECENLAQKYHDGTATKNEVEAVLTKHACPMYPAITTGKGDDFMTPADASLTWYFENRADLWAAHGPATIFSDSTYFFFQFNVTCFTTIVENMDTNEVSLATVVIWPLLSSPNHGKGEVRIIQTSTVDGNWGKKCMFGGTSLPSGNNYKIHIMNPDSNQALNRRLLSYEG